MEEQTPRGKFRVADRPRQRTIHVRSTALRSLSACLLAAALAAPLASCAAPDFMSFPPQTRGNKIDPDQLAQLVPGTSTRADAAALIGTPTTRSTFDDNDWIYISEVTKPLIAGTQELRDQSVVELKFDDKGVLRSITKRGADDAKDVAIVERKTPSPGNDTSILTQLLGNVGRFTANPLSGEQSQNSIGGAGAGNKF
jgi:outer membrane protein assembly factor BamE (lipoprotein component of BamABCDE complex)